jgi:hypothetical protein
MHQEHKVLDQVYLKWNNKASNKISFIDFLERNTIKDFLVLVQMNRFRMLNKLLHNQFEPNQNIDKFTINQPFNLI